MDWKNVTLSSSEGENLRGITEIYGSKPGGEHMRRFFQSNITFVFVTVLFVMISFQSCAAGLGNAIDNNNSLSGIAGFCLAICMMIAGIIAICTRKSVNKIPTVLPALFYWFGSLLTIGSGDTYGDLPIWGTLSFIFGLVFVVACYKQKK